MPSRDLKSNNTINIKNHVSYNYIKHPVDRPCGGSSVIINNCIPHSEIKLNTNLQAAAISATHHKIITVCSIYIPPSDEIKESELNNLVEQLPRPFIIMRFGEVRKQKRAK